MKKVILVAIMLLLSFLTISCNRKIKLPDIIGETYSDELFKDYELNISINYILSDQYENDIIISYDGLNPNDEVEKGKEIVLNVCKKARSYDDMVFHVEEVASMLGPDSINFELLSEMGAYGADLGMPVKVGDRLMYLFGDTFSGDNRTGLWNSNFAAFSSDFDFSDGIIFDEVLSKNGTMIMSIARGKHQDNDEFDKTVEVTKIPTGAIQIGEYVYVFYMSVRYWGGSTGWLVTYNQCIKASVDDLTTWTDVDNLRFNDEEAYNFGQIYPFKDPNSDYIYLYAIPGGRTQSCVLARTTAENFENKDEIEYLVSEGTWVKGSQGLQSLNTSPYYICKGAVGEVCVSYNAYLGKYMMTFTSNRNGKSAVYMMLSDNPDTEFTGNHILFDNSDFFYYGAFLTQDLMEDSGKTFYIIASRWSTYRTYVAKVVLK